MASLPRWRLLGQAAAQQLPRSSHSVTAVASSRLYLFGGEHLPRVPVDNVVYQYDWSSGQWAPLPVGGQAPRSRVAHAAASVGKWLYVFGGRAMTSPTGGGKDGSKPCWEELGDLYRLDTEALTWEQLAADGAPEARSYHAMAADEGGHDLYVFGGCGKSGRLGDLHRYDTATGTWHCCPAPEPSIVGRGGAGMAVVNGKVYVVGGFYGKEVSEVLCYDSSTRQWSAVERQLQPPRSVFAIGVRNSRIYVFGGELDPSTKGHEGAGAFYDQVEVFDPATAADVGWQKLSLAGEAPVARGWLASAMTQSGWFLHGGLDSSNQRLSDEWLLELP